jgi:hypothetical protein
MAANLFDVAPRVERDRDAAIPADGDDVERRIEIAGVDELGEAIEAAKAFARKARDERLRD